MQKQKRPYLDFRILRTPFFSDAERSLLIYVYSFSNGCFHRIDKIANDLGWSSRSVKRTTKTCCDKGILIRSYGNYKRLILRLAPRSEQSKFYGEGLARLIVEKAMPVSKPWATVGLSEGPRLAHSKKNKELRINKKSHKFSNTRARGRGNVDNLEAEKRRQLDAMKDLLLAKQI